MNKIVVTKTLILLDTTTHQKPLSQEILSLINHYMIPFLKQKNVALYKNATPKTN